MSSDRDFMRLANTALDGIAVEVNAANLNRILRSLEHRVMSLELNASDLDGVTDRERISALEQRVNRWEKFQPECIVKRNAPTAGQKAVVITLTMVVPDGYEDDWRDDPTIEQWSEMLMDEGHPIFGDVYIAGGLEDFPGGAS